jgi:dipeptidyl aminopeptidase/acylaminoacyl peptidase
MGAAAAACGGGSAEPEGTDTPLGSSVPIQTAAPVDVEGTMIVYRNTLDARTIASTLDQSREFVLDFDPNVESLLSFDCAADGSRAVYVMENNTSLEGRIVIAGAAGRSEFDISGEVTGASISPDGSKVAVSSYLSENARGVLSIVDVQTGDVSVAYDLAGTLGTPGWSPDGDRLVFHALSGDYNQLFVYTLTGGDAVQLTDLSGGAFSPDWSPDGKLIAFSSVTGDGNPQIFTMPALGGAASQLTGTQIFKAEPRWSPDGSQIAYVGTILVPTVSRSAALVHNVAVYTSASDGSDEVPFTDLALDAWLFAWCESGPWLGQGWTEQ